MNAASKLVYVTDDAAGFARQRRGKGFVYLTPDGQRLTDAEHLLRIRQLAIPPAYTQVWICTSPKGHLQATGRDARGRKQYRYHNEWRQARDASKFDRMLEFGAALPRIRARVKADLAASGAQPTRSGVLAALVRLLDTTLVRIGNEEYARTNGSFGLTTLRNRHAVVKGSTLQLRFRGKSGVFHQVALNDPRVARIVRRCQALPGQELFQYQDENGDPRTLGSAEVNDYLRDITDADFTAKDFRTWHASVRALDLNLAGPDAGVGARQSHARQVLSEVAARLGNTVAVCKKSYVHPRVLLALLEVPVDNAILKAPRRKAGMTNAERRFIEFLS